MKKMPHAMIVKHEAS